MAGFCYFFPAGSSPIGDDGVNEDMLERMNLQSLSGLKSVIDDYILCDASLESQIGQWLYPKPHNKEQPPSLAVKPDQEWRDRGAFWIGWWKDNPPRPADLAREDPEMLTGYKLEHDRTDVWVMPIIRSKSRGSCLKTCYVYDKEMNLTTQPKKKDAKLWKIAGEIFEMLEAGGDPGEWTNDRLVEACLMFMNVNYRIGPHEASVYYEFGYEMFDSDWVHAVLNAATDYIIWSEFKKKLDRLTEIDSSTSTESNSPIESSEKPANPTVETCA